MSFYHNSIRTLVNWLGQSPQHPSTPREGNRPLTYESSVGTFYIQPITVSAQYFREPPHTENPSQWIAFSTMSTLIVEEEERLTEAEYALEKCNDSPALGIGTYKSKRNQAITITAIMKCLYFFIFCIFLENWPIKIILFPSTLKKNLCWFANENRIKL